MRRHYDWERVERHLREATGSLEMLRERILELGRTRRFKGKFKDGAIGIEFEHVYHNLNFAWNTRFMSESEAESNFELHEKWPVEFELFERKEK